MPADLRRLASGAAVDAVCTELYGDVALRGDGVVQVAALADRGADELAVIRIGPHAPTSDRDFLVLHMVRAWAGAIVVSGEILRREPQLSYDLSQRAGWETTAGSLVAWRRARGFDAPRRLVVLTRSGELPLDHPVWSSVDRSEIHTGREGAERIAQRARARGVAVVVHAEPGPRRTVADLQASGERRVSMETGPRASAPLYEPPAMVDTVFRSVYTGQLDPAAEGPRFEALEALGRRFAREPATPFVDGAWRFERWTRERSSP